MPPLAPQFADAAGVRRYAGPRRRLRFGCARRELAARVGEENVAAIDPAEHFAAACQARIPGADVREGDAESLPWGDGHLRRGDVLAGRRVDERRRPGHRGDGARDEARRHRRRRMWDLAGGGVQMLAHFWGAARRSIPNPDDEPRAGAARATSPSGSAAPACRASPAARSRPARRLRRLRRLLGAVHVPRWARPGPTSAEQPPDKQAAIRDECFPLLGEPSGPFDLEARAWYARGTAPASAAVSSRDRLGEHLGVAVDVGLGRGRATSAPCCGTA